MSEKSQDPSALPEDELYTYDSFGPRGKKKEAPSHFLWWCAGAHQKLLKLYPSEHTKYSGLGGVLLATFLLATLSSGYAARFPSLAEKNPISSGAGNFCLLPTTHMDISGCWQ